MNKKDIKDIFSQKREYKWTIILEYINIYINSLLFIKGSYYKREQLTFFLKDYLQYDKLESELLKYILKVINEENYDLCLEIINDLEEIFFKTFNYNEFILESYREMIELNNLNRANILPKEFTCLDENLVKEYKSKLA